MRLSYQNREPPATAEGSCLISHSPYYSTDNFPKFLHSSMFWCKDLFRSAFHRNDTFIHKNDLIATFRAKFISCVTITIVICSAARSLITFKISPSVPDPAQRSVHQKQHLRFHRQCPCDRYSLLPSGELIRICIRLIRKSHLCKELLRLFIDFFFLSLLHGSVHL